MLNILIPRTSMKGHLNTFWKKIKGSWVAPYMTHQAHGLAALTMLKQFPTQPKWGPTLLQGWFDRPLRGAAQGWESRYPLPYDPTATIDVDLSGANGADMMVLDFCSILEIGCAMTVTGTATLLVMDFDLYPTAADNGGDVVDKLDTVNGVITAPSQASQVAGCVIYKDLGHQVGMIDVNKGSGINANVTTTVTSGTGVPYVLVIPRAESNLNKTSLMFASA